MSKFLCDCGQVIFDQADYIRYKGHIIADQDYMDFFDEIEKGDFMEMVEKGSKYFGRIFQCEYCSSLIVFRPGKNEGIFFKPIDKDKSKQILSSFLGESWLGVMSANFRNGQGEIFWTTNCDSGF
ncbi:MAG: hypothetical protein IPM47_15965 [Sphingobacteriales bacterium]|nr:MAG: hypothetical protein IPM47_15965 [Sphingobacteriales bacterium]